MFCLLRQALSVTRYLSGCPGVFNPSFHILTDKSHFLSCMLSKKSIKKIVHQAFRSVFVLFASGHFCGCTSCHGFPRFFEPPFFGTLWSRLCKCVANPGQACAQRTTHTDATPDKRNLKSGANQGKSHTDNKNKVSHNPTRGHRLPALLLVRALNPHLTHLSAPACPFP